MNRKEFFLTVLSAIPFIGIYFKKKELSFTEFVNKYRKNIITSYNVPKSFVGSGGYIIPKEYLKGIDRKILGHSTATRISYFNIDYKPNDPRLTRGVQGI